ncbi:GntR family transcriptional regulator [Phaeodactylibacter sp.]|jgi:DNA-binding transcriptional regulator YhcF (GntR family)|uniref:GntR family transcriptional regulator n=1 Tax=Phaeodactylibacter sp. TaxID=1940289 RepID=UPI0025D93744|nr:GntR family transcriptional regulator [Phaeodactylibacter sp.]MCI5090919.1 GntR family transcriptional regulator [Phaeodactylibacter sp.]
MDFKNTKTIYVQIADYICENILAEKIKPGEKIQSVREMAATIQVNPNTVMRTYSYLQEQEIIYNKRGIGYFVADDATQKTTMLRREEFITQYLPEVFKTMELLDIDFDELKSIYHRIRNGHQN